MHQRISTDSQRSRQGTSRLRNFASWQRKEWKRLQKGEPSDMTSERIQKLEEIGFEFVTNPKRGGKAKVEATQQGENLVEVECAFDSKALGSQGQVAENDNKPEAVQVWYFMFILRKAKNPHFLS